MKKISSVNAETQTVELCKTDELSENTEENYEDYISITDNLAHQGI